MKHVIGYNIYDTNVYKSIELMPVIFNNGFRAQF